MLDAPPQQSECPFKSHAVQGNELKLIIFRVVFVRQAVSLVQVNRYSNTAQAKSLATLLTFQPKNTTTTNTTQADICMKTFVICRNFNLYLMDSAMDAAMMMTTFAVKLRISFSAPSIEVKSIEFCSEKKVVR